VYELRKKIDQYFAVVLRNLRDTIPKLIGNYLVRNSQDELRQNLFQLVSRSEEIFSVIHEDETAK